MNILTNKILFAIHESKNYISKDLYSCKGLVLSSIILIQLVSCMFYFAQVGEDRKLVIACVAITTLITMLFVIVYVVVHAYYYNRTIIKYKDCKYVRLNKYGIYIIEDSIEYMILFKKPNISMVIGSRRFDYELMLVPKVSDFERLYKLEENIYGKKKKTST